MPKAWQLHAYTGHHGLVLEDVPLEEPGDTEVRLTIEAFAVNWGDMHLMRDEYSFSFEQWPARIGMEAVGVVDAVGPAVTGIEPGMRMCTIPHFYGHRGASAETLVVDQRYLTPAPAGLTPVECASIWMQYLTAWYPLAEVRPVGPGSVVLATAATSTTGASCLEIGRRLGATMIGTTRSERNAGYLRELGADHVLVTGDDVDVAGRLLEMTGGHGVDLVFDAFGDGLIHRYAPALARDAWILFYGMVDGRWPTLPFADLFQANAVFKPYSVFNYVMHPAQRDRGIDAIRGMLERGEIRPRVDRVFPFEQYVEAFDYTRDRATHGKVVIATRHCPDAA
ncbi:MAG: zinc-binding dehydrogenase [Solirubrobacteraceae bacterium]|nr:zinc-binding dehydrogenase [Solirubrobacteraceae bacterium]